MRPGQLDMVQNVVKQKVKSHTASQIQCFVIVLLVLCYITVWLYILEGVLLPPPCRTLIYQNYQGS